MNMLDRNWSNDNYEKFSLLKSEHYASDTFRYIFKDISIVFRISEKNGGYDTNLTNSSWIYDITIHAFKNDKLHKKYGICGGYKLEDVNVRIRKLLKDEIKEVYGDLL